MECLRVRHAEGDEFSVEGRKRKKAELPRRHPGVQQDVSQPISVLFRCPPKLASFTATEKDLDKIVLHDRVAESIR